MFSICYSKGSQKQNENGAQSNPGPHLLHIIYAADAKYYSETKPDQTHPPNLQIPPETLRGTINDREPIRAACAVHYRSTVFLPFELQTLPAPSEMKHLPWRLLSRSD